jgi:hypothetical protein
MCAISGVILGTKRPKYNNTLRATATTPTTSTTIGLLSVCSNLFTYLGPPFFGSLRVQRITQTAKPRTRSAVVVPRTSENTPAC